MWFSRLSIFEQTQKTRFWGTETQGRFLNTSYTANSSILVCCTDQWCGILHYFIHARLSGVDYYQMQGTYILSDAQQLPQNAGSRKKELLLTLHASSVFLQMEVSEFMEWELWSNRLASKITWLRTNWLFPLKISEGPNVLYFSA